MENLETQQKNEQVNALLQGEEADLFREYMREEGLLTKASAGYQLIVKGLRRWKQERTQEANA